MMKSAWRLVAGAVLIAAGLGVALAQDATTTSLQLLLMGNGLHNNDWGTQTNTNMQKLETAIAGISVITVGGGSLTLTNDQARSAVISFVGTLTSDETITVPARTKLWVIDNSTTGGHNLYVKTPSGSPLQIPPFATAVHLYFSNGTNFLDISSDAAAIADVTATANAALPKAGGTMTGAINMGTHAITALAAPSTGTDAATKTYVDTTVGAVAGVPAGAVEAFNLSSCPTGWAAANGSGGTVDMRGYFVRGLDGGVGHDPDSGRALASLQGDQFQDHQHQYSEMTFTGGTVYAGGAGALNIVTQNSTDPVTGNHGSETRPKNVALLYCQKS